MTDAPIFYLTPPSAIVNQALDRLSESGKIIGDVTDGSPVAEVARRNYGQALRQLLRAAHWDWARKNAKLTLLADATGNSAPPISPIVECPWTYAYAWPIDAVQGRWMPWNPSNAQPVSATGIPLTTGTSALTQYPLTPGRFLVASSDQYPIEIGSVPWTQLPDLQRTEGVGPINRKIILTDCCQAHFVYTRLGTVIEEWDAMFREALVSMMAMVLAPTAITDKKLMIAERDKQAVIARNAIADARVANGNESGWPQGVDHIPIWLTARSQGYWSNLGGGFGGDAYSGYVYYPWDAALSWCGSVF